MNADTEDEYAQYDGLGLAELVARGEVSASELLEAAMARADRYNPSLNAIIHRFDQRASTVAKHALPKGPFAGVPFLFKDFEDEFAGEPLSMGSRGIRFVPEQHSELVKRYLATGVVPFGKTNTPELGLIITTEPKAHGATHNPWGQGFSSGGSSGGSAAAVAARIVPMASANDGGGSIRFPAACCGVFGLKPSRGRNPSGPRFDSAWNGATAGHVISLSVRDSAAMLDATQGAEHGAPFIAWTGAGSYLQAAQRDPEPLRIGFSSKPMIPAEVHPEALSGLHRTVALLQDLGHEVEEADPLIDTEQMWRDFSVVVMANTASLVEWLRGLGPQAYALMEPATKSMVRIGQTFSAVELLAAHQGWHQTRLAMGQYLQRYDVLLTPTLVNPPKALGELPPSAGEERLLEIANRLPVARLLYTSGQLERTMLPVLGQMAFTAIANVTGLPAMSVPLHWTEQGLPLGMQFIGRMCDELTLYQLAGQLERAQPWCDRRPSL
jgi:amidase